MANKTVASDPSPRLLPLLTLGLLTATLIWAYWNSLTMAARYWDNPKYSHGYLVPLFTLILLWLRRDLAAPFNTTWAYLGGGLMAAGAAVFAIASSVDISAPQASLLEMVSVQLGL